MFSFDETTRSPPETIYFFFQAEDGIRDATVTGVQTCALPIFSPTGRNAIRTRSLGISCTASSSRPSTSPKKPSAASRSVTTTATWWTRPIRRRCSGTSGRALPGVMEASFVRSDGDELAMLAPGDSEPVADLADRCVRSNGIHERRQEILVTTGRVAEPTQRGLPGRRVALVANASDRGHLTRLRLRIDPLQSRRDGRRGRLPCIIHEPVDADHDLIATLDGLLRPVGGFLDLPLLEAVLDRGQRAAEALDLVEVAPRGGLQLIRQRLDVVRPRQRIRRLRDPALVGKDLLGAEGEPGRLGGRQRERLVARVGVEALGPAKHRGQGLDGGPDDVVVDGLGGQAGAGRLDVEAAHHRTDVR